MFETVWEPMFPGLITRPPVLPTVLHGDTIVLEGHRLQVIETGLTDTRGTTAVCVPDLRLIVAGDGAYDDTHQWLLETTRTTRREWIAVVEKLQALDPVAVVAGHKNPEHTDDPAILAETAQVPARLRQDGRGLGDRSRPLLRDAAAVPTKDQPRDPVDVGERREDGV